MQIRRYTPEDLPQIAELFYNTVHTVNARDYTREQLDVWATGQIDSERWNRSFLEHCTFVAVEKDAVIGFGDMDETGYLDRLYVHKDYQNRGVATALCDRLEQIFPVKKMTTHASITAKSFFLRRGYRVLKEQQVVRKGVALTNFVMEKEFAVGTVCKSCLAAAEKRNYEI